LAGAQPHAGSIQAAANGGEDRLPPETLDGIACRVRPQHLVDRRQSRDLGGGLARSVTH
jgi:hypothetical protein